MPRLLRICVCLAVILWQSSALAQFEYLASRVPSSANAMVLINAPKIYESPAAKKNGWKAKIEQAHSAGVTLLSPNASYTVLSAELDLDLMVPIWQSAVMEMDPAPELKTIVERTGGTAEKVDAFQAVRLPTDSYVIQFTKNILAVMTPANRQSVGRWVQAVKGQKEPIVSPYLKEAYGFANNLGTPVVMALDLNEAITADAIRAKLTKDWKDFGFEGKADMEAVINVLASIRGVTLGVTLLNEPFGKLKVDFAEDVGPLAPIAKEMLLHVLHHRGAMITEFEDWTAKAEGKQVTIEGNLTGSGMRRLFSLFDRPPSLHFPTPDEAYQALSPAQKTAKSSLAYYQQVNDLLKDLKNEPRTNRNYTIGSMAAWYENYARKIDSLPLLNVDPELLDFGAGVSQTLRQACTVIRHGASESRIRELNLPRQYNTYTTGEVYGYSYRSGYLGSGYVPYGYTNTYVQRDQAAEQQTAARVRMQDRSKTLTSSRDLISLIDAENGTIRRKMTQKYNMEF